MTYEGKAARGMRTHPRPDINMTFKIYCRRKKGDDLPSCYPRLFSHHKYPFWSWIEIFLATLMLFSWSISTVGANTDLQIGNGICQRKYIRNNVDDLNRLRGCKVIEGSLQISLIDTGEPEHYKNLSFPDLKEITGYLLLFQAKGLTTLRNLFPNLAVIRGQELLHSYALVITDMDKMQEIGLQSLTNIERGSVWIEGNANLCYVDTIEWSRIVNDTSDSSNLDTSIYDNKSSDQCPDTCPSDCPKSDLDERHLCWSNTHCQRVDAKTCPSDCKGPCHQNGECCDSECLGGCYGKGPDQCFVCKHVSYMSKCQEACPGGFYEYLKRRCLSKDECLAINSGPSGSQKSSTKGKLYRDKIDGKLSCVLECPKDTELSPNGTDCISCDGACKKNCSGAVVETIEGAKKLAGCTRIVGTLIIKIRGSAAGKLVKELKENLDKIEEIDNFLIVTYTYSIYSLDFLENLKRIRGNVLDEGRYALVVKSNENLVELWNSTTNPNRTITIDNKNARVLFHYNPKLCPNKIWEFVNQAGIVRPKDDKIDIGITNGDKVPCNQRRLAVVVRKKSNSSVTIQWENFRRNLTQTNHLLNYEVSYKEAPEYPKKNVSIYDNRDPCGEDDWKVLDIPKMPDKDVQGLNQLQEPEWEYESLINGLKHFTWYSLYVKTIVIPDETSPNNNTGAQSAVIYFQTLPDTPSKPQEVTANAKGPNILKITWEAPLKPNGILQEFRIYMTQQSLDRPFHDQRNYCLTDRPQKKDFSFNQLTPFVTTSDKTTTQNDKDCCSCSASGGPSKDYKRNRYKGGGQTAYQVQVRDDVYNAIMDEVFVANPNYTPDNKTESNEVPKSGGRKRRRRELVAMSEDSSSDSNEKVFPGERHESYSKQPVFMGEPVARVEYNASVKTYQFMLENLTHYTTYTIEIQACRVPADTKDIENDTRTCSEVVKKNVQTNVSPTADDIDVKSISTNITGNRLHLRWAEPKEPNGIIMAYKIKVLKVSTSDSHQYGTFYRCTTRKQFQENGRNYTFPDALQPGNYSVQIQVISLAMDSNFTELQYFYIEDNQPKDFWFWLLVILLPLMLLICIVGLLTVYYIRNKGWTIGPVVISHNPEYMENVDIPDEWEVTRDQIELLKELGNGSFGMVFEGILKDFVPGFAKLRCAVKTVADEANSEDRALFLKEAELMTKLHCHHLVKLIGVVSKTQPTFVVMELMAHGDLKNYLRARRPDSPYNEGEPPPTLKQILRIACEISDGMAYIHSHKLVHRDLAARNCMVAEDRSVKVGDFGMTKEVIQTDYYRKQTRGLLPVRWMAPESLRDGVFTNQTDVWSFGVVLWEMATLAAQPYQGLSNSQVLLYVQGGGIMERPDNCPEILFNLMLSCWDYDQRHRPTFTDILENLTQDLDASFAAVSFFHSREGQEFKYQCKNRPINEEPITVRTPLRATMEDIDSDLDEYDSDEDNNLQGMMDDLNSSIARRRLPTSPTLTTTGSMPTNTTTASMNNGLALIPLSSGSGQLNNNNPGGSSPPTLHSSQSLQNTTAQIMPDISSTPTRKPYTNSNNNYASTTPGGGSDTTSGGFVCLNLTPNQTTSSSAYTPNGVDNIPPIAKYTTNIPNSQSSEQINSSNRRVNNSGSNSNSATTPNSAPPGSNDSSKALSIAYSSDGNGSKVSNGGANLSGSASAGPGTGSNGYITLRHSPVTETYQKNNRTSQF